MIDSFLAQRGSSPIDEVFFSEQLPPYLDDLGIHGIDHMKPAKNQDYILQILAHMQRL
jgi:hypothetical protein